METDHETFAEKWHLEASGFSFRTNVDFKCSQLHDFLAYLKDSGVKNLKVWKKDCLTKCQFIMSLYFSVFNHTLLFLGHRYFLLYLFYPWWPLSRGLIYRGPC